MDEPRKELELAVPSQLTRLAQLGYSDMLPDPPTLRRHTPRGIEPVYGTVRGLTDLGPTDASRVRGFLRAELQHQTSRYMQPRWLESQGAVPGLLISLRYTRQDAHGISRRVRDLDMAFRRAGATLENYYLREQSAGWAYPTRPERGGLWVLESRRGSYEVVATVYGTLVIWAMSTPVSLASLACLAWDSAVAATRVGRWTVGKFHGSPEDGPPKLGSPHDHDEWGVKQTKALEPVMREAAKAGSGLEYVNNAATGEVRLTIYPNSELDTDDE